MSTLEMGLNGESIYKLEVCQAGAVHVELLQGFRVARLAEVTSTNTVAAEEARRGATEGLVVVAEYQSAGRGRFERRWEAPPGASLLFSVLLSPTGTGLERQRRQLAVAAVSLAVAGAAEALAGVRLALKWPNDLLSPAGKKVAGVLAEVAGEALVVGAGVNVHWAPEGAACLDELAGRPLDKGTLLEGVLAELGRLYGNWEQVARLYQERLATLGQGVVVRLAGAGALGGGAKGAEVRGKAVGLTPDGALVVERAGGDLVEVVAGDVEHLRPAQPG
jgi:BirA family biotin operon repressor/biotin-[acetyl-CoA-carboxylase] ligase